MLPLIKVVTLLARQLSKPIANAIKSRAILHPLFARLAIGSARRYNDFEVRMRRRILGLKTVAPVRQLDDEKALELAADMLGEMVLFAIAGGILTFEFVRQKAGDAAKEADLKAKFARADAMVEELRGQLASVQANCNQLQSNLHDLMQYNVTLDGAIARHAGGSAASVGLPGGQHLSSLYPSSPTASVARLQSNAEIHAQPAVPPAPKWSIWGALFSKPPLL